MRQLQLHEYLAVLQGGAKAVPIDNALRETCLVQAQKLWPELQYGSWEDFPRSVEHTARCVASGSLLVHISGNWRDCFLILIVPPDRTEADAYLLFDIGAEYQEPWFSCPAFRIEAKASEEIIEANLPKLHGLKDPFAVLEIGNGTYLQAYAQGGVFDVEHQLVSLGSHYRLVQPVGSQAAVQLFLSYAFGKKEWARDFKWERMVL